MLRSMMSFMANVDGISMQQCSSVIFWLSLKSCISNEFHDMRTCRTCSSTQWISILATVFEGDSARKLLMYFPDLFHMIDHKARCLKIIGKVSFNIECVASYVYILSGQKLIKNAKNGSFWRVFENLKLAVKQCYQTGQF